MNNRIQNLYTKLEHEIDRFQNNHTQLPRIQDARYKDALIKQIISSIRRIEFIYVIQKRNISPLRSDPNNELFDPIRASIIKKKNDIEESYWLVFLATHFGKNKDTGWRLLRDIYGAYGSGNHWTWARISNNPNDFTSWLSLNYRTLLSDGIARKFGNHRKYESYNPNSHRSLFTVFESYVDWVGINKSHISLLKNAEQNVGNNPEDLFGYLYDSMSKVLSFGRTAKFDYLTMLFKLGIANIYPRIAYIRGSTGPRRGANLLFGGNINSNIDTTVLENNVYELGANLTIGNLRMQVLEDALCNWQKSPDRFVLYRG